jgi:hypothetical protein
MNAINVDNNEIVSCRGTWIETTVTGSVAQLNAQTKGLEFDALKK